MQKKWEIVNVFSWYNYAHAFVTQPLWFDCCDFSIWLVGGTGSINICCFDSTPHNSATLQSPLLFPHLDFRLVFPIFAEQERYNCYRAIQGSLLLILPVGSLLLEYSNVQQIYLKKILGQFDKKKLRTGLIRLKVASYPNLPKGQKPKWHLTNNCQSDKKWPNHCLLFTE